ncbi:hypothetical protein [Mobilicoccus massiliensis]|uniref:hypothetical protein n=1 Tax=Mobilicoccus massiliensis TaxID=1522310 RepID=UPI001144C7B3|nr:hypothetical protein [Mobilicoccus massiliensis]
MKSHRRRAVTAGAALVLSLTLAGCGGVDPQAAARYGDRVVSESDVATAVAQLNELQLPQPADARAVTQYLALGPVLLDDMQQAGFPITEAAARQGLQDKRARLAPPTVDVLRTMTAVQLMQQAGTVAQQPGQSKEQQAELQRLFQANEQFSQEVQKAIDDGSFVVNPKYGKQQVNWISQDAETQMPEGHGEQQPEGQDQAPPEAPEQQQSPTQ